MEYITTTSICSNSRGKQRNDYNNNNELAILDDDFKTTLTTTYNVVRVLLFSLLLLGNFCFVGVIRW
jgi:hypothetical protein